jgi:hypothetical protein
MGKFKGYCHTAVSLVCPEVVMYGKNDESLKRAFTSSMSSG